MAALYQLEIVTPMGRKFEGLVDNCVFRSTECAVYNTHLTLPTNREV